MGLGGAQSLRPTSARGELPSLPVAPITQGSHHPMPKVPGIAKRA